MCQGGNQQQKSFPIHHSHMCGWSHQTVAWPHHSQLPQQNRFQHMLITNASSLSYIALENQPCYEDPSGTMLELLDKWLAFSEEASYTSLSAQIWHQFWRQACLSLGIIGLSTWHIFKKGCKRLATDKMKCNFTFSKESRHADLTTSNDFVTGFVTFFASTHLTYSLSFDKISITRSITGTFSTQRCATNLRGKMDDVVTVV